MQTPLGLNFPVCETGYPDRAQLSGQRAGRANTVNAPPTQETAPRAGPAGHAGPHSFLRPSEVAWSMGARGGVTGRLPQAPLSPRKATSPVPASRPPISRSPGCHGDGLGHRAEALYKPHGVWVCGRLCTHPRGAPGSQPGPLFEAWRPLVSPRSLSLVFPKGCFQKINNLTCSSTNTASHAQRPPDCGEGSAPRPGWTPPLSAAASP